MDDDVRSYLDLHPWHHEATEHWPIQGNLRVRLSLAAILPPARICSSILAIVLNADRQVLYLWPSDRNGSVAHFLVGGRSRHGETPQETVIREVAEETGWIIKPIQMIGFRHFFHLEARSEKSDRPYPDFVQPIFVAKAIEFRPNVMVAGDELPFEFIELAEAELSTDAGQRPLLKAAVRALTVPPEHKTR